MYITIVLIIRIKYLYTLFTNLEYNYKITLIQFKRWIQKFKQISEKTLMLYHTQNDSKNEIHTIHTRHQNNCNKTMIK
jgi:hypothetical protein